MTEQHPTFLTGPRDAAAYAAMEHTPHDLTVHRSYHALCIAIVGQWNGLRAAGFEFVASADDPYACSDDMLAAVRTGSVRVFTDGGVTLPRNHPMQASPIAYGAERATVESGFRTMNDVFRGVHDVMGHYAAHRNDELASFGPIGEYNAWRRHWLTLPNQASLALWCETRGQNAYTNFYGNHAELPIAERPYVDQRAGLPQLPLLTLVPEGV
jgi:hypothetical protein